MTGPGGIGALGDALGPLASKVTGVLGSALNSVAGEAGALKQFFLWQVVGQLVGAALGPALADIEQAAWEVDANLTLTPQELAVGVLRGIFDPANSQSEAAKSGIGPGRFQQLTLLAGQPPSLSMILAAYQRQRGQGGPGAALGVDIDKALADLGISSQYRALVEDLATNIPDASQVLNAWLEGQILADEATSRLLATGMDPTWIQTAYNANGQAPTPVEALEMLNRGLIAEDGTGPESTSWNQAFLEGPWRNKWAPAFLGLRYYVPPPRTVTAMLKEGALTEAQAMTYFKASGLDDTLTAIYVAAASHTTSHAQRELTQAQIVTAYEDGLLTQDEAHTDLVAARFTASDATLLLALADKKQALASTKSATTRLRTLFLNGTNNAAATSEALTKLGLSDTQVANLVATWQLETAAEVKTLTEGQIVAGWFYNALDADGPTNTQLALSRLQALGYTAADAMILLVARNHSPLSAAQGGTA